MKVCPKCECKSPKFRPDAENYCFKCGAELEVGSPTLECKFCKKLIKVSMDFCPYCGKQNQ